MQKTVKIELIPNSYDNGKFDVVKLTNSIEFHIGQALTKARVKELIRRPYTTVVVKPRPESR